MTDESWYSKVKDNFDIEISMVEVSKELKKSIDFAKKRQSR